MTLTRARTGASVILSHTFYVGETPTDVAGTVTATVKRLDGTAVSTGAAAHPGAAGVYTYVLPAQTQLDILTVDWTASGGVAAQDHLEIVGGFLFDIAEARAMAPALDPIKYPTAMLEAKRTVVEQEFERICRQAFVPRFKREARPIIASTVMPTEVNIRAVRRVLVAGVAYTGWRWPDRAGPLRDVYEATYDTAEVVLEYEHGMDYPPEDIREAALLRLRHHVSVGNTSIPARATSFTVTDGGVYRLAVPGEFAVGTPDIDAVLAAHRIDVWGFA